MKKVLIAVGAPVVLLGAGFSVIAARFEPTVVPNTFVGDLNVGGLSKDEAAKKVRIWWEAVRINKLTLENKLFLKPIPPATPTSLGISVDDQATVADLPMTDLVQAVSEKVSGSTPEQHRFEIRFKTIPVALDGLKRQIKESVGKVRQARVIYSKGQIIRQPEMSGFQLDDKELQASVLAGLQKGTVEVPLQEAPKRIPDTELEKIKDVVSEFSTRFPSYQTSRNTNIRLASSKLNGVILLPGQQLSFNQTVGQRTVQDGYREAPVLKNGRHDRGIGGGICQVSTTLYNSALLADLKIVRRNNHSIPSVYVPIGRDATVDWGSLDLIIGNSQPNPVAISSSYENGRITFRVLGQKDPTMTVKIVTANHQVWSRGSQTVVDRSIKPGSTQVIERGSRAHSVDTYRIIYQNGVEIRREHLNHSVYGGSPTIVASNPAAPKPAAPKPGQGAPGTLPVNPPTVTPPPIGG